MLVWTAGCGWCSKVPVLRLHFHPACFRVSLCSARPASPGGCLTLGCLTRGCYPRRPTSVFRHVRQHGVCAESSGPILHLAVFARPDRWGPEIYVFLTAFTDPQSQAPQKTARPGGLTARLASAKESTSDDALEGFSTVPDTCFPEKGRQRVERYIK